jgi:hypothetical protein
LEDEGRLDWEKVMSAWDERDALVSMTKLVNRVEQWSLRHFRYKGEFFKKKVDYAPENTQGSNLLFQRNGELGGMSVYLALL